MCVDAAVDFLQKAWPKKKKEKKTGITKASMSVSNDL